MTDQIERMAQKAVDLLKPPRPGLPHRGEQGLLDHTEVFKPIKAAVCRIHSVLPASRHQDFPAICKYAEDSDVLEPPSRLWQELHLIIAGLLRDE